MEPVFTAVISILGKYAMDKGSELVKAVGDKAIDKAKELYKFVLDRLRKEPAGEVVVAEYKKEPEVYEKPLELKLTQALEADPGFAQRLRELLEQFDQAAKAHSDAAGVKYQSIISGTGSTAHGTGSVAATATKGGIAIGKVGGDVHVNKNDQEE